MQQRIGNPPFPGGSNFAAGGAFPCVAKLTVGSLCLTAFQKSRGGCNGFFLTVTQSLLFARFSGIIFWIFDGMVCERPRQNRSARQIPRQIVADDRRKIKREVNNRCVLSVQIIVRHA